MTETRMQQLYSRRVAARGAGADCVTPEAILAVVRREGPEEERLGTLEHVMSCSACHREYEWLVAVDQAGLEAEDAAEAGAAPRRAWWRGGAPLALAASIAVVVGAAVVLSRTNRTEGVRGVTGTSCSSRRARGPWRARRSCSRGARCLGCRATCSRFSGRTGRWRWRTRRQIQPSLAAVGAGADSAYRWWVREVTEGRSRGARSSGR